ncbi:MAG TPA: Uma2 family endonuclease [Blastocatellia bacterium]|nr:Uma2 family endonuclease [Blastocatellia bacterium]HMV86547.1 Uma2 family endonuclease [Blastocatellia bacterium]HMX24988.1 Uma2 family endonuclease [Blastocatellia bacterium]HMY70621.1 Uma2 family endonuclease [Blastocatellia bacterium]HMZ20848.1 Uma2 family endonuclease [Blastocatellia bacterium]
MTTAGMTVSMPEGIQTVLMMPELENLRMTDAEFMEFCAQNPELRIEMTSKGELIVMSPVTGRGGNRNFFLTSKFGSWVERDGTGVGFDSSTCFTLPNGAKRSPDASWIEKERWEALTPEEQDEFPPICPDFVVELRSKSDRLKTLEEKMEEYLLNGARLGWLIDPLQQRVHIYRPGQPVTILNQPHEVSGEPLLKGFVLNLAGIL